jgi:molybdopterin/thiamine biosynthesis adenylyltransferase
MIPDRYNRQTLFSGIGPEGQQRICAATAVIAGCGALGSVIANALARAGVGHLRIIDRDFVEESNLHRQALFDEQDCREHMPKAAAAERRLKLINSTIAITGLVTDINPANAEDLLQGADVVVDGTDNFETRFVLNDACVKHGTPWVYGGAVGSSGMLLTIIPGQTPCLRCVFEVPPPHGAAPTCDTVGVLGALPGVIGSWEASEALKICAGRREAAETRLLSLDLWSGQVQRLNISAARQRGSCPCCQQRKFEFLEGRRASTSVTLCGRNAVQINPRQAGIVDLPQLAARLQKGAGLSHVLANKFLVRFHAPGAEADAPLELTVFADGRAIIKGTGDVAKARTAYAKYVGL